MSQRGSNFSAMIAAREWSSSIEFSHFEAAIERIVRGPESKVLSSGENRTSDLVSLVLHNSTSLFELKTSFHQLCVFLFSSEMVSKNRLMTRQQFHSTDENVPNRFSASRHSFRTLGFLSSLLSLLIFPSV